MPPFILQRLAERETDLETEEEQTEETGCQPPDKETKQLPAQYYAWSSTGTETEDDGGNQDGDWAPGEEPSTEDEAEMCTEDEDNTGEDQNEIKYVVSNTLSYWVTSYIYCSPKVFLVVSDSFSYL